MRAAEQPVTADPTGPERRATLRWRSASLTETVGRAPLAHGRRAGEAAR
ncbi:DUF6380 family protein [Streptomyces sp. NPDC051207]